MDYGEELERIEHIIYCVEEAISYLNDAGFYDVADELRERVTLLNKTRDVIYKRAEEQDEMEEAALTKEYYRAVI